MIIKDAAIAPYSLEFNHRGWEVHEDPTISKKGATPVESLQKGIDLIVSKKLANETNEHTIQSFVVFETNIRKAIGKAFEIPEEKVEPNQSVVIQEEA